MVTLGRGINWIIDNHQLSDPLSCYPMSCGMLHCLVYIWFVQSCLLLCLYSILPSTAHFMNQCQWCSWHWVIETNVTASPWNWISEVHIARHVCTQRHQLENLAFVTLFGSMSSCQLDATEALVRVKVGAHRDPPTKYNNRAALEKHTPSPSLPRSWWQIFLRIERIWQGYDKNRIWIEKDNQTVMKDWWGRPGEGGSRSWRGKLLQAIPQRQVCSSLHPQKRVYTTENGCYSWHLSKILVCTPVNQ